MTTGTVLNVSGRNWPHRKAAPGVFVSDPLLSAVAQMLQNAAPPGFAPRVTLHRW